MMCELTVNDVIDLHVLNGLEIYASVEDQEQVILSLAAGQMERDSFTAWLKQHVVEYKPKA
jgi:prophage maintenance system killer protein